MKKVTVTALALAFSLGLAGTGLAADEWRPMKDRTAFTLDAGHLDSKTLVGMKVHTPDGKHVGEIDQLIFNTRDGKVSHAVVGLGGLAGIGERHVVVPWSQVKINRNPNDPGDRKDMVATIERSVLDNAARYERVTRDATRDRTPAASPATAPNADRDRDGVRNKSDRAPDNPRRQ